VRVKTALPVGVPTPLAKKLPPEQQVPRLDQDHRVRLNQRLRQAFIDGAEEDSRRRLGRGLTAEELERALRRYPGDLTERREK
jgi:hypothetical protein